MRPTPSSGRSSAARARRASRTPCGTAPRKARPAGSCRSRGPGNASAPQCGQRGFASSVRTSRPFMASTMRQTSSTVVIPRQCNNAEHWKKRWSPDLRHLLPGVDLHELRVLVGGEHEERPSGRWRMAGAPRGPCRAGAAGQRGVEEGDEVADAPPVGGMTSKAPLKPPALAGARKYLQ